MSVFAIASAVQARTFVVGTSPATKSRLWLAVNEPMTEGDSNIAAGPNGQVLTSMGISMWGDGTEVNPTGWILVLGPGSIDGHTMVYPGNRAAYRDPEDNVNVPNVPELQERLDAMRELLDMPDLADFSSWDLIDSRTPPAPAAGKLIDNIILQRQGTYGDIRITLVNEWFETLDSVTVSPEQVWEGDYGDCPPPYPTRLADNGARHKTGTSLFLGRLADKETDGQPMISADGDDMNLTDDEDGVLFLSKILPGYAADVYVSASASGLLDAWVDLNGDGDWDDEGEQIFESLPLVAGWNVLSFNVPGWAAAGESYARFRLSTAGRLKPTGPAEDGEVEDYKVTIEYCYPTDDPAYADFVQYKKRNFNQVDCWCAPPYGSGYQCDGDIDGETSGYPYYYRVYTGDLNRIITNWLKRISDPTLDPCADIDHTAPSLRANYRVDVGDLGILKANWKKTDAELAGDCPRPE